MAGGKIEYNGEMLYLTEIAKREGLIPTTFVRYYERTNGDVYEAVKLCKAVTRGPIELIQYKGQPCAISAIAQKEGISYQILKEAYGEFKDIYKAIEEGKKRIQQRSARKEEIKLEKENKKQQYYGRKLSIEEISEIESVDLGLLKQISKEIEEPQRAVFTTKCKIQSLKTARAKQYKINLYDMSLILGIKYRHMINFLVSGMSVNEIKEKFTTTNLSQKIKFENKKILLEFCKQKNLDFTFIYRAIHTYRKDLSTAMQECQKDDKNIPMGWITERYLPILQRLNIPNMQTTVIVKELQKNKHSLEEAIEKSIIRKNARMYDIPYLWAENLYGMVKAREILGIQHQSQIVLSETEQEFINSSEKEIQDLIGKIRDIPNNEFPRDVSDIKLGDVEEEL